MGMFQLSNELEIMEMEVQICTELKKWLIAKITTGHE